MTCFHPNRNTGVLTACAHDPCSRHGYNDDIHADSLEDAYAQYNECMRVPGNRGRAITRAEFDSGITGVGNVITSEDWQSIRKSVDDIESIFNTHDRNRAEISRKIYDYMVSDDRDAVNLRRYCGDNIDYRNIADFIAGHGGAMTGKVTSGATISRYVLTRSGNDMNKKRYIASILFFGGRCCYCGKILHANHDGRSAVKNDSATAEHIDPIAGHPHGETKYGNMALCCRACNSDKGSKDMRAWLRDSTMFDGDKKREIAARVESFRKYTMYEIMSSKKSDEIDALLHSYRLRCDGISREVNKEISDHKRRYGDITGKEIHRIKRHYNQIKKTMKKDIAAQALLIEE